MWVRLEIVKDVENVHHVSDTLKPKAVLKKKIKQKQSNKTTTRSKLNTNSNKKHPTYLPRKQEGLFSRTFCGTC